MEGWLNRVKELTFCMFYSCAYNEKVQDNMSYGVVKKWELKHDKESKVDNSMKSVWSSAEWSVP